MKQVIILCIILTSCKVDWQSAAYGHLKHKYELVKETPQYVVHRCKLWENNIRCVKTDTFWFRYERQNKPR